MLMTMPLTLMMTAIAAAVAVAAGAAVREARIKNPAVLRSGKRARR